MEDATIYGLLKVVVLIVVLVAAVGVLAAVCLRALRRFVRAFWPH